MSRDMFGNVVRPSIKVGTRQWYTASLSIVGHTVVIGAAVIVPLMAADVLPTPPQMTAFVAAPAPPPPPPFAPVRVGGNIEPPQQIRKANPVYSPIALSARVQGVVILEAVIGPNGEVQDVKVLRSIPLLDQAAIEAIKQWQYTPTLLNGVPVPVAMTVTVNFTLR